jgi:hypothetical protein
MDKYAITKKKDYVRDEWVTLQCGVCGNCFKVLAELFEPGPRQCQYCWRVLLVEEE